MLRAPFRLCLGTYETIQIDLQGVLLFEGIPWELEIANVVMELGTQGTQSVGEGEGLARFKKCTRTQGTTVPGIPIIISLLTQLPGNAKSLVGKYGD